MEYPPCLLIMFILGFTTDLIYVWGTKSIANNKALQAAVSNTLLTMVGLSATWIVIDNKSVLEAVIYLTGCFLGSYITMKLGDIYAKKTDKTFTDTASHYCNGCSVNGDSPHIHTINNRRVD